MRVTIEKIIFTGKSLARVDGKVVFIEEGIPGEIVDVMPVKEKKNYTEAVLNDVITQSPYRVAPRCDHYKICSPYQYIEYSHQAEIKKTQLKEFFSHNLNIEPEYFDFRPAKDPWGYRNKMHLKIIHADEGSFLAYNKTGSSFSFSRINKCYLADEDFNRVFASITNIINEHKLVSVGSVAVRKSFCSKKYLLTFYGTSGTDKVSGLKELADNSNVCGIVYIDIKKRRKAILHGDGFIEDTVGDKIFRIGPESFFQINIPILELMLDDIRDYLIISTVQNIVDAYCGLGTFGILLSGPDTKVTGIELLPENLKFLNDNVRLNCISNYKIAKGYSEKILPSILANSTDVLILDPPRKGVGAAACSAICKNPPARMVYISCDPATLTRDLKWLLPRFKLKALYGYDFFPNTTHIETAVFLEAK